MVTRITAPSLDPLLSKFDPEIAAAFREAVNDLRGNADLQAFIRALSRKDLPAAIAALHLEPAAYAALTASIGNTFAAGGLATAAAFPNLKSAATGARLVFRFDGTNPRAESWLKNYSSSLITRILDDQLVAVREALTAGMEAGTNPTTVALDIIGRVNKATGAREGGIIGLTSPQEEFVRAARDELASGDVSLLQNYLNRARRDRRFDSAVVQAMDEGGAVPYETASRAITSYSNRLLQLRGETIGTHEAFAALGTSRKEAFQQAVDKGVVKESAVKKRWRHFPSKHPRAMHVEMNNVTVGLNEPFILPDGTQMMFPHDPTAPVEHTAGCHCQEDYVVDFLSALKK